MTESEWWTGFDPAAMLDFLAARGHTRKFRLFACAWCRRRDRFPDPRCLQAVEVAERYADGTATDRELAAARQALDRLHDRAIDFDDQELLDAADLIQSCICPDPVTRVNSADASSPFSERARDAELVREVFGNPFCPVAFVSSWRTATTLALAESMYDSRDYAALPALAEALQDAGCEDADVHFHCRSLGPHVRGCWVVDLVLGRE